MAALVLSTSAVLKLRRKVTLQLLIKIKFLNSFTTNYLPKLFQHYRHMPTHKYKTYGTAHVQVTKNTSCLRNFEDNPHVGLV